MRRCVRAVGGPAKKLTIAWHFGRAGGWGQQRYDCTHCKARELYRATNCRKYYPDEVKPDRICWSRRVPISAPSGGRREVGIAGTAIKDCPASFITDLSVQIMDTLVTNRVTAEAGAALFGPVASKWPAWFVDALLVVEQAEAAERKAVDSGGE